MTTPNPTQEGERAMVRIELPFPVPLSACFKDVSFKSRKTGKMVRTRAPTSRYEEWQRAAHDTILQQKPRPIRGMVSIFVRLVAPDKRQRDAGNCDKAICDILVKAGLIEDDNNRFVKRLTYQWADDGPPCIVLVQPFQAEMAA